MGFFGAVTGLEILADSPESILIRVLGLDFRAHWKLGSAYSEEPPPQRKYLFKLPEHTTNVKPVSSL